MKFLELFKIHWSFSSALELTGILEDLHNRYTSFKILGLKTFTGSADFSELRAYESANSIKIMIISLGI